MIAVSAVLIVIGLVMTITMTERWQLWLGTGVLLGIAPGMTALVVSATVASRWFTARRGLVVGDPCLGELLALVQAVEGQGHGQQTEQRQLGEQIADEKSHHGAKLITMVSRDANALRSGALRHSESANETHRHYRTE